MCRKIQAQVWIWTQQNLSLNPNLNSNSKMMAELAKKKKKKKPSLGSIPNMEFSPSLIPFQSQVRAWFFLIATIELFFFYVEKNSTKV